MDTAARDSTEDWLLPGHARPPLVGELEQRIDLALAVARASEAAVTTVAELAEQASAAALAARGQVASAAVAPGQAPRSEPLDDSLSSFSERADRLVERLHGLQRIPLAAPAASGAAGQPQSAR
jgi:hypothetical protein